jgi:2-amino-4-hydroxy-6-hydroxymethyldihydropteridine diphosphokinase
MVWVTLSLGSNIDATANLSRCLDTLLLTFRDLSFSSVFESEAVGFAGDNFLNMVVGMETDLPLEKLISQFKKIEDKSGRQRTQPRFSGRTLDIDILTYGNLVGKHEGIALPRPEITENAFVLWPLSQVAGKHKHPVLKQSFADLWLGYDKSRQKLWPVDFCWHDKLISSAQLE